MDVTVIIINYNSAALTANCLESIFRHTQGVALEVLVIDNASPQEDLKGIETRFAEVRFVYNRENGGFGKANNQGIRMAKGKYVFLLNPDTLLTSNAIGSFFRYMEQAEARVACCGCALVDQAGAPQVSYGNFPGIAESIALLGPGLFYKQYYTRKLSAGVKVYQEESEAVDYLSGAALFIRKKVLEEVGGFDEDFFLYFEETRLAFVLRQKGYQCILLPSVKIVHLEGGSQTSQQKRQKQAIFAKSRKLFLQKSYGPLYASVGHTLYLIQQALYRAFHKG